MPWIGRILTLVGQQPQGLHGIVHSLTVDLVMRKQRLDSQDGSGGRRQTPGRHLQPPVALSAA